MKFLSQIPAKYRRIVESLAAVTAAAAVEAANAGVQAHKFNWAVVFGAAIAAFLKDAREITTAAVAETIIAPVTSPAPATPETPAATTSTDSTTQQAS